MDGILLAVSPASKLQPQDTLTTVQIVMPSSAYELVKHIEKLRPEVLVVDHDCFPDKEIFLAHNELVPWGYTVSVVDLSDGPVTAGAQHVYADEMWLSDMLTEARLQFLQHLALLNRRWHLGDLAVRYPCADDLKPYFDGKRFASPCMLAQNGHWQQMLSQASQVLRLAGFALPWPVFLLSDAAAALSAWTWSELLVVGECQDKQPALIIPLLIDELSFPHSVLAMPDMEQPLSTAERAAEQTAAYSIRHDQWEQQGLFFC